MDDARAITWALGGSWHGSYGTAPCPICQPERRRDQRALSIADGHGGRLLLRCFKSACAFSDVMSAVGLRSGNWSPSDPAAAARRETERRAQAAKRAKLAHRLWREARGIEGTPAERYLRARGIRGTLPRALRYHPEAWHGPTAQRLPAMVAEVQGAGLPAVHRTFVAADGSGKATVRPAKLMLGSTSGGAVRLSDGPEPLVVCEGIETGLALLDGLAERRLRIWSALSTSGMRALRLPAQPGAIFIAPDGDRAGIEAAEALARRAAGEGWTARIMDPPGPGLDWADWVAARATEAAA